MPATRLLVVADSKMLPALANGLRESGKFEVTTVALSEPAAAQAAAEKADAMAVFYGAPGVPLTTALQSLSPKVRQRGGRVVAVLQREQAMQRDDCFRSGASDLLFMPMPKAQFVARLQASVELSWAGESGAPAPVAVATRTAASKLDQATVTPSGVEAKGELPVKSGDTVRLSWGAFQAWGLVVRPAPTAQIRFAGLAPDEEAKIRDWLQNGPSASKPAAPAAVQAPPPAAAPPARKQEEIATPPGGSQAVRAPPASGPPPGFADRKPIRPQTKAPTRIPPPVVSSSNPAPAVTPAAVKPVAPRAAASNGAPAPVLAGLFEDPAAAAPAAAVAAEAAAVPPAPGPPWPVPVPAAVCKAAAMQLVKDKAVSADTPAPITASAKKVTGMLSSTERGMLEKLGSDSQFANVLAARIALDAATTEGVRLYSSIPAPSVDAMAVAALTKQADDAAAALQKEAGAAIGKGAVESLQMVTSASAALSRDLLTFKETADRLRGIGAAPRLGAGALDPEVVLPGQAPRPKPLPSTTVQPVKAELRDFAALDESRRGKWKPVVALILILGFAAAAFNAFYLSVPHHKELPVEGMVGVVRVDVTDASAMVTVTPDFVANSQSVVPRLATLLRERSVKKAILVLPTGTTAGVLDVTTGKVLGLKAPPK